jgi:hypothetical protein
MEVKDTINRESGKRGELSDSPEKCSLHIRIQSGSHGTVEDKEYGIEMSDSTGFVFKNGKEPLEFRFRNRRTGFSSPIHGY